MMVHVLPGPDGRPVRFLSPLTPALAASEAYKRAATAAIAGDFSTRDHWRAQANMLGAMALATAAGVALEGKA